MLQRTGLADIVRLLEIASLMSAVIRLQDRISAGIK